jgi:hypothetical protein
MNTWRRGSEIGPKSGDSGAKIAQNTWLIKYIRRELAYTRAYSVDARFGARCGGLGPKDDVLIPSLLRAATED